MIFYLKLKDTEVSYNELTLKDYKTLLKSLYGDIEDYSPCLKSLSFLVSSLTGKPNEWVNSLNLLDFVCFFLDLRSNSLGNSCSLTLKKNEKTNINLNLNKVQELLNNIESKKCIQMNNSTVCIGLPSLNFYISSTTKDIASYCVETVTVKDKLYCLSLKESADFLNALPLKQSLILNKEIENLLDSVNQTNLFSMFNNKELELFFNLTPSFCVWLIKLIFGEPLEDLFANIFYLSHHSHINASYLETCSVGEYKYFVNLLRKTLTPPEN